MLWEANFHRPNYDLVPLGEYIYLGGNIKQRTAIKTAGILLPVFLFSQIQCWWQQRHFFFPFQTFLCPHLHSSGDPLSVQHHSVLSWKCGMKIAVFSVDPGAVGLAGDGARQVFPTPALHFGWELTFWQKREVCHNNVCHWLSKISGVKRIFFHGETTAATKVRRGRLHRPPCAVLPQLCLSDPLLDETVLSH